MRMGCAPLFLFFVPFPTQDSRSGYFFWFILYVTLSPIRRRLECFVVFKGRFSETFCGNLEF